MCDPNEITILRTNLISDVRDYVNQFAEGLITESELVNQVVCALDFYDKNLDELTSK